MEDPMAAIRVTFFQECEEQLAELATGLTSMADGTADAETVNAVFRAVHSMKGGAGIFALDQFVRFAHVFETALDKVRSGTLTATPSVISTFLRAADMLEDIVNAAKNNEQVSDGRVNDIIKSLDAVNKGELVEKNDSEHGAPVPATPASDDQNGLRIWKIRFKPYAGLYAKANEAALLLREISRLGEVETELDVSALPKLEAIDPEGAYFAWDLTLRSDCEERDIRDVFEFVEDDCELEISEESQEGFAPGTVITGDNGFKFEFFGPVEHAEEEEPDINNFSDSDHEIKVVDEATHKAEGPAKERDEPAPVVAAAQAKQGKAEASTSVGTTIRVDLDRVDRMINLVGELVINEAMLNQRLLEAGLNRASGVATALEELEHLTREIQDSVMAIRAQPVRSVFQRMPRLVRELETMTGKRVHLTTEGEGTEVDKTVVERISDPLTHMIRNAIDHGIESPEVRIAAGKPSEGSIRLTAVHRSGRIVLEVADDGAGINRSHVRQKAIDKGLIVQDAQLSDEEIDNLIFLPGFSTAETISDISGRGVGMDVVRQSVQELGGRISISSRPGQGSTFTLSLPLTLAVLDGMVVSAHGHTLIIPLGNIVETLKPKAKDIFPLDGNLNMLALRGGYVPIVDIACILGYVVEGTEPEKGVALLVENEAGARIVLLVDAIHGQRQVVIKSLESNYRSVPGIAAATVMGDGRIALIVDVGIIVKNVSMTSNNGNAQVKNFDQNGKAA